MMHLFPGWDIVYPGEVDVDRYLALMGGDTVEGQGFLTDIDPSTGVALAEVANCQPDDIDKAVSAAREAFESCWRRYSPYERGSLLRSLADSLKGDSDALARLESRDTGKPLRQAFADVRVAIRYFEFCAGAAEHLCGQSIPLSWDTVAYTVREPFGVTGHIIPWNYPLQIACRTVAPALAAGNCAVLKPAEEAPLTAIRLAEHARAVGFPPGVLNVVPGVGETTGAALASHPGIDHLAFTGSQEVGSLVAAAAAANVVPVSLELGGKSPNILFDDAHLDSALPMVANSIIQNAGQTCSAGSRLLVHRSIHETVVRRLAERLEAVKVGAGIDDPDLGPLISEVQRDRVEHFVNEAKQYARLVIGGQRPDGDVSDGYFFLPTIFDEVPADAAIAQEEVFGPVVAVIPFSDEEEAISLANATPYGLIAAIWTNSVDRAHRVARELRVGQVYVNTYGAGGGVELPFGGYKRSGYGREKGMEGLQSYSQLKTVAIKLNGASR